MKILAIVIQPEEVARLCESLGEVASLPQIQPSRYQVQTSWEFTEPP